MDNNLLEALAGMCRAYLNVYEENIHLKLKLEQQEIEFAKSIENCKVKIDYLQSLQLSPKAEKVNTANIHQQSQAKTCEMCGNPLSKPTNRFCSTSCQVKFSHQQRGHNVSGKPTPKRRYTHRKNLNISAVPNTIEQQTVAPTEEKSTALGK